MMMKKIFAAAVCALCLVSCGQKKEAAPAEEQQPATEVAAEEKAPAVIKLAKGATIAKEAEKLVVIDFNATWCGPCRQFAPTFDKVSEEYADRAVFYSVDVDDHNDLAAQYNVPVLARIPMDAKLAAACDAGKIEFAENDYMNDAMEVITKL